jgi:hypothetical protein
VRLSCLALAFTRRTFLMLRVPDLAQLMKRKTAALAFSAEIGAFVFADTRERAVIVAA